MGLTEAALRKLVNVAWGQELPKWMLADPEAVQLLRQAAKPAFTVTNPHIPKRHPLQQEQ